MKKRAKLHGLPARPGGGLRRRVARAMVTPVTVMARAVARAALVPLAALVLLVLLVLALLRQLVVRHADRSKDGTATSRQKFGQRGAQRKMRDSGILY